MKSTSQSHCAVVFRRLKQLTLTAAAALTLALAPAAIAAAPTFQVLKNFDYYTSGANLRAGLVQGADGALYGTVASGGSSGVGTVFKLNADGSGFTVLHNFNSPVTGANPQAGLVQGADGALYGTALSGGSSGKGTVFKLNVDGSGFTVLRNFNGSTTGAYPFGRLVQGADGALYGTTYQGGSSSVGTVFKLNADGSGFTVLHNFNGSTTGAYPQAGLVQGADGALYGTAPSGGSGGLGTVFKLNADGSGFTVLRHFTSSATGANPRAGLVQGTAGALYGTTPEGGSSGVGTVFKLNADGSDFTVLHNFDYPTTGANPEGGLVQGADGTLYGTTSRGGYFGYGTVFKLNADGTGSTKLQNFDYHTTGGNPSGGLVQGTDGALYGTASMGGSSAYGTVFRLSLVNNDITAPVLSLPGDLVVEATSPAGATVTYTASATDDVDGSVAVTLNPASGSTFPLGTTTVNASATDAAGNAAYGSFTVTVRDTTAPVITSLSVSSAVLWPPNHKMVSVSVSGAATEAVSEVTGSILSVTSNEPDNGLGDGDTAGDIVITSPGTVSLRAERSGKGNGRIYTILFEASDASGNTSTKTVTVTVPKSQGK